MERDYFQEALEVNKELEMFDKAFQYTLNAISNNDKNGYLNGLAAMRRAIDDLEKKPLVGTPELAMVLNQKKYILNKLSMEIMLVEEYRNAIEDAAKKGDLSRFEYIERNFKNFKFEFIKIE